MDSPSVVVRALEMRGLQAGVAVLAITLNVVAIISHGGTAHGLCGYCCPHTGLCSSERPPQHTPALASTRRTPPPLSQHCPAPLKTSTSKKTLKTSKNIGKHSWIRANPGLLFSPLSSTCCSSRGKKKKKGAREEAHFYLQVLSARSLCSSAPASTSCH